MRILMRILFTDSAPNSREELPDSPLLRIKAPGHAFASLCRSALAPALLVVVLGGCAPDAFRPDAPYEAYLNQLQNRCQYQRIGRVEINSDLLQDPYFLDVTSRFFNLETSQTAYLGSLEGAYGATPDSPGVRCLLGLLPQRALPPPAVPPPPPMASPR